MARAMGIETARRTNSETVPSVEAGSCPSGQGGAGRDHRLQQFSEQWDQGRCRAGTLTPPRRGERLGFPLENPLLGGEGDGLGARFRAELALQGRRVKLHRALGDAEGAGDLLGLLALGDESQNLALAW